MWAVTIWSVFGFFTGTEHDCLVLLQAEAQRSDARSFGLVSAVTVGLRKTRAKGVKTKTGIISIGITWKATSRKVAHNKTNSEKKNIWTCLTLAIVLAHCTIWDNLKEQSLLLDLSCYTAIRNAKYQDWTRWNYTGFPILSLVVNFFLVATVKLSCFDLSPIPDISACSSLHASAYFILMIVF